MAVILSQPAGTAAFSGSYAPSDVQFLLRPVELEATPVEEKERLIQSGEKHYSEMISEEGAPSETHLALYREALKAGGPRMAREIASLAKALQARRAGAPTVLVSFVRAGVPLGVLLKRALVDLGVPVSHYGVSIIRDRGIDEAALAYIEARHPLEQLVFVDGWTGKGAIYGELSRSLGHRFKAGIPFLTLADPAGLSWLAASGEDWLIPSGILGATVSGLVSRSILTQDGGFHGCVLCGHLAAVDVSRSFIEEIDTLRKSVRDAAPAAWSPTMRDASKDSAAAVIAHIAQEFGISNRNRIKPGIAEATRAVLRRVPERILVRSVDDTDVRLLYHLAQSRGVTLEEAGATLGPYRAVTIIKRIAS